jgi:putative sterol carrier protein
VLIQELEEQVKMDLVSVHYQNAKVYGTMPPQPSTVETRHASSPSIQSNPNKKYKLFSQDQINEIVKIVNNDPQMQELGTKTSMNMDLAVCLQETGDIHSFKFQNGKIVETGHDANAEFLITANENIWRAVFNREIDPFVATTQKKMTLRGDFARISKWYAPCSRIFQLWTNVPVE